MMGNFFCSKNFQHALSFEGKIKAGNLLPFSIFLLAEYCDVFQWNGSRSNICLGSTAHKFKTPIQQCRIQRWLHVKRTSTVKHPLQSLPNNTRCSQWNK